MARFELRPAAGSDGFRGEVVVINDTGSVAYQVVLSNDAKGLYVEETDDGFHVDAFWLRP